MGMSASQARYLALTERMNDIEYQGQQINQQRTTLSDQVNALYNSLLVMNVPTPPSTQDYTKVVYSGIDGASSFTIDNVVPHGTNYSVDLVYKKTGHGLTTSGTATAAENTPTINLVEVEKTWVPAKEAVNRKVGAESNEPIGEGKTVGDGASVIHLLNTSEKGKLAQEAKVLVKGEDKDGKATFEEMTLQEANAKGATEIYSIITANNGNEETAANYNPKTDYIYDDEIESASAKVDAHGNVCPNWNQKYILESDGTVRKANADDFDIKNGVYYYKEYKEDFKYMGKSASGKPYDNPDYDGKHQYTVGGNTCYTLEEAYNLNYFTDSEEYQSIRESIINTYPDKEPEDFQVYFTTEGSSGKLIPHFVLTESFSILERNENGTSQVTYNDYIANGTYTSTKNADGCNLTFDNDGRITRIDIPRYDADGNLTGYSTIPLEAKSVTDDVAYEEAYNQYEYQKHLYDKEQQEVNAQTSVIQAQDKKLELKLTRLDNERNAVNTELEAVKKVIQDNIEKSFKTFSG